MAVTTEEAIIDLTQQTTALLDSVNVTKSSIQGLIDVAVEAAENQTVLTLLQLTSNSVKTQTLFLTFINK